MLTRGPAAITTFINGLDAVMGLGQEWLAGRLSPE